MMMSEIFLKSKEMVYRQQNTPAIEKQTASSNSLTYSPGRINVANVWEKYNFHQFKNLYSESNS